MESISDSGSSNRIDIDAALKLIKVGDNLTAISRDTDTVFTTFGYELEGVVKRVDKHGRMVFTQIDANARYKTFAYHCTTLTNLYELGLIDIVVTRPDSNDSDFYVIDTRTVEQEQKAIYLFI